MKALVVESISIKRRIQTFKLVFLISLLPEILSKVGIFQREREMVYLILLVSNQTSSKKSEKKRLLNAS